MHEGQNTDTTPHGAQVAVLVIYLFLVSMITLVASSLEWGEGWTSGAGTPVQVNAAHVH